MKRDLDEPDEEKESMGEKVFNTFVGFVPQILEFATQSMAMRKANPLLNMAKNTDEYKAMKDPAVLAAAVNRLDAKFSPLQTDKILETMELPRPEATKKNYEKYREPTDADTADSAEPSVE